MFAHQDESALNGRNPAGAATRDRWWDPLAALLLLAALTTAASRLAITNWTDHLGMIQTVTFLGILAGLALGQSRFSTRSVVALALAYSLFAVPWQLGRTLDHDVAWLERLVSLFSRLTISLDRVAHLEPVRDPLLFLFLMTSLFWGLSAHAGYALTRYGHPWRAILPTGLALLVIQAYDPFVAFRAWFLAVYFFFCFLLLARLAYLRHRTRWQRTRTHLPPYIGMDIARFTLLAAALFVLLAWTIPAVANALPAARQTWRQTTRPWAAVGEYLDRALAPLRGVVFVEVHDYYGNQLPLGRGIELADTLILTIEAPPRPAAIPAYYWRARVYDYYADGQWTSTFSITRPITPTPFELEFPELTGRRTVTFTFEPAVPIATLYTAPQPRWVSRPVQVDLTYNPDGTADLSALHATVPLRAGDVYQTRASLSAATVAQLRAAGTDYPQWVADRYLQLPPTITPRTRELARQIAHGLDTPYDVAIAVTDYLRANIHYNDALQAIQPYGQESLDWFLFDLREGFCNYYASAEIVLLRSLGIPARLAVGFAQGERQPGGYTYLVRQLNAHAWTEVYFPGLGWIEFEPTASQPSIQRPLGESPTEGGTGPAAPGETEPGERDRLEDRLEELLALEDNPVGDPFATAHESTRDATPWVVLLALGMILLVLAWRVRRLRGMSPLPVLLAGGMRRLGLRSPSVLHRWTRRATLPPMARAYLELNRALTLLGAAPAPADTPAERTAALTRLLPAAATPARRLLAEYHATTYGPHPGKAYVAQKASRAIRNLSWKAFVRRLSPRR